MARRTDWAKAKVWTARATLEIAGPIADVAVDVFGLSGDRQAREQLLIRLKARHQALCELEDTRTN